MSQNPQNQTESQIPRAPEIHSPPRAELDLELCPWLQHLPFVPPAILPWHESKAEIRCLFGGRGTSKTTSGSLEGVFFATGYNPIRDETYPTPNEGWAVCLRLKDQGPVMREAFSRMLPYRRGKDGQPRPGWKYFKQDAVLEIQKGLPGAGSIIRLKQQEDGPEAFFGGRPLWMLIDEEKAGSTGQRIFNQLMGRRTPGQKLYIMVTMTPEHGYSWTHSRLVDKTSEILVPNVFVHFVSKFDITKEKGGFLERSEIVAEAARYDEIEAAAAIEGRFMPIGTNPFFQARLILDQMESAPHGRLVEFENGKPVEVEKSNARIIRSRESGGQYVAAWDPSSGVGADSSVLVVFHRNSLAEVYHASSNRVSPSEFALRYVLPACNYYNQARLAIEINGEGGGAALDAARSYENIYRRTVHDNVSIEGTQKVGWRTTDETRRRIFDALNKCLIEKKWTPSYELLEQMGHVVKKPMDRGGFRPDHPDGKHDDHVVAAGIALAIHYEEPLYDEPDWASHIVRWQDSHLSIA